MGQYEQTHLPVVDTAQDLRAIAARQFHAATPIIYMAGVSSVQDGYQGWVEWQALTATADDNINVFKPNWVAANESGRWVRLTSLSTNSAFTAKSVSGDYQIGPLDFLIRVDASGASRTITAPPIATAQARSITIKKIDSSVNAVIITGDATFDGAASVTIGFENESKTIAPNDQNTWDII
jgi:hypothetical protein